MRVTTPAPPRSAPARSLRGRLCPPAAMPIAQREAARPGTHNQPSIHHAAVAASAAVAAVVTCHAPLHLADILMPARPDEQPQPSPPPPPPPPPRSIVNAAVTATVTDAQPQHPLSIPLLPMLLSLPPSPLCCHASYRPGLCQPDVALQLLLLLLRLRVKAPSQSGNMTFGARNSLTDAANASWSFPVYSIVSDCLLIISGSVDCQLSSLLAPLPLFECDIKTLNVIMSRHDVTGHPALCESVVVARFCAGVQWRCQRQT